MAFTSRDQSLLNRMLPIGVGDLTRGKLAELAWLRQMDLVLSTHLAAEGFVQEPLALNLGKGKLDLLFQPIYQVSGLNQAYAQKIAYRVIDALINQKTRYFRQLKGRLGHCSERIDSKYRRPEDLRQYYYVPLTVQDRITEAELKELEAYCAEDRKGEAIQLFRQVIVHGKTGGLTDNQVAVIHEIHRQVQAMHHLPQFGADADYTSQFMLDCRLTLPPNKPSETAALLNEQAVLLRDIANVRYHTFLEIANPHAGQPRLRLPILFDLELLKRLDASGIAQVKTFCLAIGPDQVKIRAVMQKPAGTEAELDPNRRPFILSRDAGITNTVTWALLKVDAPIEPTRLEWFADVAKMRDTEEAKRLMREFIETHAHPGDNAWTPIVMSARRFRDQAGRHFHYIDRISREIDQLYDKIERLKSLLCAHLGLKAEEWIPEEVTLLEPYMRRVHQKFFGLLHQVRRLKQKRRERYDRIEGLKKSWLGYLANQEVALAKLFNASVAREQLTYVTIPTDSPLYRGKRFNRDMNQACRGRYSRTAAAKLAWEHIPELVVPSYYTSKACLIHSLPEGWRKDEDYRCPLCGEKIHADAHAAVTIGLLLLARPLKVNVRSSPSGASAILTEPVSQEAPTTVA
jgi:hypothetical protein